MFVLPVNCWVGKLKNKNTSTRFTCNVTAGQKVTGVLCGTKHTGVRISSETRPGGRMENVAAASFHN